MTPLMVNEACIGEIYCVTFITCKLLDCWTNNFPFPSSTLDICLTHCMYLEDLSDFMNCTPPITCKVSIRHRAFFVHYVVIKANDIECMLSY